MKKNFKKIRSLLWIVVKLFISIIFLIIFIEYFMSPIYKFPEQKPFHGDKIWNPYAGIDSLKWYKCNFHLHTQSWKGLTDGRKNNVDDVLEIYKNLGYNVISISNYEKIEKVTTTDMIFIPTYEHGYNIQKTHHLCVGSKSVDWLDYPLYQTIHQKQFVINWLRDNNELVALAHPILRLAYSVDDMKYLTNYDCIEVINHFGISEQHWDAALSSGKPVYIIGNDDAHDINNTDEVGHCFTMAAADTLTRENILNAIKSGQAYGVNFHIIPNEKYQDMAIRVKKLPTLKKVNVSNDSLFVEISQVAKEIRFIGQHGTIKKVINNSNIGSYLIHSNDTYIRTVLTFEDETKFYLNPVFRFDGNHPNLKKLALLDTLKTIVYRFLLVSVILVLAIYIYSKRKRRNF
jgi:hypothetical protein